MVGCHQILATLKVSVEALILSSPLLKLGRLVERVPMISHPGQQMQLLGLRHLLALVVSLLPSLLIQLQGLYLPFPVPHSQQLHPQMLATVGSTLMTMIYCTFRILHAITSIHGSVPLLRHLLRYVLRLLVVRSIYHLTQVR
jgi:hypothetical protein